MEITIYGKVYDLENYKHPGGKEILKLCENEKDCTALFESYPVVMNMCRDKGYKFTGREHIMAFGTERCV